MVDSTIPTKTCTKCQEDKPLELFTRDKRKKSGYGAACLDCENARKRAYIAADRTAHVARCGDWARRNPERVREISRAFRARHLEEERERDRVARAAEPDKHREKVRRSYQKHRKARIDYGKAYSRQHRDRLSEMAAARRRAAGDAALLLERESRARIRCIRAGAAVVDVVDYAAILKRDGYHCHICKQPIEPATLSAIEFDHIIPVNKGGNHTAENVAVSHLSCNKRKWDKLL